MKTAEEKAEEYIKNIAFKSINEDDKLFNAYLSGYNEANRCITIDVWDTACRTILKEISITFLSKENQDKADIDSDRDVFQAIGETIQNFPIPKFKNEQ